MVREADRGERGLSEGAGEGEARGTHWDVAVADRYVAVDDRDGGGRCPLGSGD